MTDSHLEWTGERFLPEIGGTIALEHIHRYLMARELAKDKDVLDIACGEGYGSAMLAVVARNVSGVDISDEAVVHATEKYRKENLKFLAGSCAAIPLPDNSIDLVVSFETIEHHDQHQEMMQEIKRVLRADGVLIISSPDKYEFTDVGQQGTHYHIKELYRHEFESLISVSFKNVVFSGQRVLYGSAIFQDGGGRKTANFCQDDLEQGDTKGLSRPLYLISVASDGDLPEIASGILESHSDELKRMQSGFADAIEFQEKLHQRNLEVEEKDRQLHQRNLQVEEKDRQLHQRNLQVEEKDRQLHQRNLDLEKINLQFLNCEEQRRILGDTLMQIQKSLFWRISGSFMRIFGRREK